MPDLIISMATFFLEATGAWHCVGISVTYFAPVIIIVIMITDQTDQLVRSGKK